MTRIGPELTEKFLLDEIETDRRAERVIVAKAIVAILIVAALIVIRQLFFV